jgi:hypothetical protein
MANYKKKNSWMYTDTKVDINKIPDPKNHQIISFIKSGIRLASCAFGFHGMFELAFIGLFLAEIVGIGEELV